MTKKDQIAALVALKDAKFTEEQVKGLEMLPDANVAHLHTLAAKTPPQAKAIHFWTGRPPAARMRPYS